MKVKICGYLKNTKDNLCHNIDSIGTFNKNKISYEDDSVKHTLIIKKKEATLIRESDSFKQVMFFKNKSNLISTYFIKEECFELEIPIKIIDLKISDKSLYVRYYIEDDNNYYEYNVKVVV